MKRNLPPLNALRVFEAAARAESFSKASDELFVTQSAVSKQVRLLEVYLGESLFERHAGHVQLTNAGREFLLVVSQALDLLEDGYGKFVDNQPQQMLTIDVIPSLSVLWMFPRVDDFQKHHPEIVLHIDSADGLVDWSKNNADAAIRCLPQEHGYNDAELLFTENLVLIASPALLAINPIDSVEDLTRHKLLNLTTRPDLWSEFFQRYNVDISGDAEGFGCEHFYMVIQAALQSFGIGLVPRFLCEDLLKEGQLCQPESLGMASSYGYYFISPAYKRHKNKVQQFRCWIDRQLLL